MFDGPVSNAEKLIVLVVIVAAVLWWFWISRDWGRRQ